MRTRSSKLAAEKAGQPPSPPQALPPATRGRKSGRTARQPSKKSLDTPVEEPTPTEDPKLVENQTASETEVSPVSPSIPKVLPSTRVEESQIPCDGASQLVDDKQIAEASSAVEPQSHEAFIPRTLIHFWANTSADISGNIRPAENPTSCFTVSESLAQEILALIARHPTKVSHLLTNNAASNALFSTPTSNKRKAEEDLDLSRPTQRARVTPPKRMLPSQTAVGRALLAERPKVKISRAKLQLLARMNENPHYDILGNLILVPTHDMFGHKINKVEKEIIPEKDDHDSELSDLEAEVGSQYEVNEEETLDVVGEDFALTQDDLESEELERQWEADVRRRAMINIYAPGEDPNEVPEERFYDVGDPRYEAPKVPEETIEIPQDAPPAIPSPRESETPRARRWGFGSLARSVSKFIPGFVAPENPTTEAAPQADRPVAGSTVGAFHVADNTTQMQDTRPQHTEAVNAPGSYPAGDSTTTTHDMLPQHPTMPSIEPTTPMLSTSGQRLRQRKRNALTEPRPKIRFEHSLQTPNSVKLPRKRLTNTKSFKSKEEVVARKELLIKRKAEKDWMAGEIKFLKENDAREAEEAEEARQRAAAENYSFRRKQKRKRRTSPSEIPNPPGCSYGMDLNYFYFSSDDDGEDNYVRNPKKRSKKIPFESDHEIVGDPSKARPYTGQYFSLSKSPDFQGGNIFVQTDATDAAVTKAAALDKVVEQRKVEEAAALEKAAADAAKAKVHSQSISPNSWNWEGTFSVPDPSDSDSDVTPEKQSTEVSTVKPTVKFDAVPATPVVKKKSVRFDLPSTTPTTEPPIRSNADSSTTSTMGSSAHFSAISAIPGIPTPKSSAVFGVGSSTPKSPAVIDAGSATPKQPNIFDAASTAPKPSAIFGAGSTTPKSPAVIDVGSATPKQPTIFDAASTAPKPSAIFSATAKQPTVFDTGSTTPKASASIDAGSTTSKPSTNFGATPKPPAVIDAGSATSKQSTIIDAGSTTPKSSPPAKTSDKWSQQPPPCPKPSRAALLVSDGAALALARAKALQFQPKTPSSLRASHRFSSSTVASDASPADNVSTPGSEARHDVDDSTVASDGEEYTHEVSISVESEDMGNEAEPDFIDDEDFYSEEEEHSFDSLFDEPADGQDEDGDEGSHLKDEDEGSHLKDGDEGSEESSSESSDEDEIFDKEGNAWVQDVGMKEYRLSKGKKGRRRGDSSEQGVQHTGGKVGQEATSSHTGTLKRKSTSSQNSRRVKGRHSDTDGASDSVSDDDTSLHSEHDSAVDIQDSKQKGSVELPPDYKLHGEDVSPRVRTVLAEIPDNQIQGDVFSEVSEGNQYVENGIVTQRVWDHVADSWDDESEAIAKARYQHNFREYQRIYGRPMRNQYGTVMTIDDSP
ncbi:hypothetical protein MMC12_007013 [Toensbergia leucococca]|nr:hypothetical protein [Toensbergia leucococca]